MNDDSAVLKVIVFIILFTYALKEASVFELHYPEALVELFAYPWWRILVVLLVFGAWSWTPLIGICMAIIVFFYFHDMYLLTTVTIPKIE